MKYVTSPFGEFLGPYDFTAIETYIESYQNAESIGDISAMINNPIYATLALFSDIETFHRPYGYYFIEAKPMSFTEANYLSLTPLSGQSIITITPTHYDAQQGCLHISSKDEIDLETDSVLATEMQREYQDFIKNNNAFFQNKSLYEFDLNTGQLNYFEIQRINTINGDGRRTILSLTYQPPAE